MASGGPLPPVTVQIEYSQGNLAYHIPNMDKGYWLSVAKFVLTAPSTPGLMVTSADGTYKRRLFMTGSFLIVPAQLGTVAANDPLVLDYAVCQLDG